MASSKKILVINPNSTTSMTEGLRPLVEKLGYTETTVTFFTAPGGPPSINNEDDAGLSAIFCLPSAYPAETVAAAGAQPSSPDGPSLEPLLDSHDAFLVACYSQHPLVPLLKQVPVIAKTGKPVTGIFEASVAASLQLIGPTQSFGIVSTGTVWEQLLSSAVTDFLGSAATHRFAGIQTTGLNATELHDAPAEEVREKMIQAAARLARGGHVGAICMGCAGMSGMDKLVREGCVKALGEEEGGKVKIVDGVLAGVAWLEGALRFTM